MQTINPNSAAIDAAELRADELAHEEAARPTLEARHDGAGALLSALGEARRFAARADFYAGALGAEAEEVAELLAHIAPMLKEAEAHARELMPTPAATPESYPNQASAADYRQLWAVAMRAGLNTNDADGMRAALGEFLGRRIVTRKSLTHRETMGATNAIAGGRLSW